MCGVMNVCLVFFFLKEDEKNKDWKLGERGSWGLTETHLFGSGLTFSLKNKAGINKGYRYWIFHNCFNLKKKPDYNKNW